MNSRIKQVRKSAKMTQQEFADKLGLTRNYIAMIEIGQREPSSRTVSDICREFGVSESWLRTGEGAMYAPRSSDEQIAAYVSQILNGSSDFKKEVLALLCSRTDEELAAIERAYRDFGTALRKQKQEE